MVYKCPKCESTNLSVNVITAAKLVQKHDEPAETTVITQTAHEPDGYHCWDNGSTMWCNECSHCDGVASFHAG